MSDELLNGHSKEPVKNKGGRPPRNGPSAKERKLAKEVVADPDRTLGQLGVAAGYCPASAQSSAWRALQREDVKETIRDLMDKREKLRDPALLTKMEEGLEASRKGQADFGIRHKYLETVLKVKGHLSPDIQVTLNQFSPAAITTHLNSYFERKARTP